MKPSPDELEHLIVRYVNGELPRYEAYEKLLLGILTRACKEFAPLAICQARAKAAASFAEKCARKWDDYTDPIYDMTDLCGGRVICQTNEQVALIGEFIEKHFDVDRELSQDVITRLSVAEFGYRSVHYIVRLGGPNFDALDLSEEEQELVGLVNDSGDAKSFRRCAEIQVRTFLQHVWADCVHDRLYKTRLNVPQAYARESGRIAAQLESLDAAFSALISGVDAYKVDFGAYMTMPDMEDEIETLKALLEQPKLSHTAAATALRIAKVCKASGKWAESLRILEPYRDSEGLLGCEIRVELGNALCRAHANAPADDAFVDGMKVLKDAIEESSGQIISEYAHQRSVALGYLGWAEGIRREGDFVAQSREYFFRAHTEDRHNPYHLSHFIETEIRLNRDARFLDTAQNSILNAIRNCEEHIRVGVEAPFAQFTAGRLNVLIGQSREGFLRYAHGIYRCEALDPICDELDSVDELILAVHRSEPELHARLLCLRKLLVVGLAAIARELDLAAPERVAQALDEEALRPEAISSPVTIVAGFARAGKDLDPYSSILSSALRDHSGTVISGGTTSGVPGLVGEILADVEGVRLVSYLPRRLPLDATVDTRYEDRIETDGTEFTELQAIQSWVDLLAAGVDPTSVRILGIGGGPIARFEYVIGLALGASVGVFQGSKGCADELLEAEPWWAPGALLGLPLDPAAARAFLRVSLGDCEDVDLLPAAKMSHQIYQDLYANPARTWDQLSDDFKRSNLSQVAYATEILRAAGLDVRRVSEVDVDTGAKLVQEHIEAMAELEHGRWLVERLAQGWVQGDTKDEQARTHPALVRWEVLAEPDREKDRSAVRHFPEVLAAASYEIFTP